MCLFVSHPLPGPQFPLVHNGEINLDLRGLLQSQSMQGKAYMHRGGAAKELSFQSGETLEGAELEST